MKMTSDSEILKKFLFLKLNFSLYNVESNSYSQLIWITNRFRNLSTEQNQKFSSSLQVEIVFSIVKLIQILEIFFTMISDVGSFIIIEKSLENFEKSFFSRKKYIACWWGERLCLTWKLFLLINLNC